MNLAAINVSVPKEPVETPTPLDVTAQYEQNVAKMKTALVNWHVRTTFASTLAVPSHVEVRPFASLRGMLLGVGAKLGSKRTRPLENAFQNAKT